MPYADPEKAREAKARWYREKLRKDDAFALNEALRKSVWLQTEEGRRSNREATEAFERENRELVNERRRTNRAVHGAIIGRASIALPRASSVSTAHLSTSIPALPFHYIHANDGGRLWQPVR